MTLTWIVTNRREQPSRRRLLISWHRDGKAKSVRTPVRRSASNRKEAQDMVVFVQRRIKKRDLTGFSSQRFKRVHRHKYGPLPYSSDTAPSHSRYHGDSRAPFPSTIQTPAATGRRYTSVKAWSFRLVHRAAAGTAAL